MKLSQLKRRTPSETIAWLLATWWGSGCASKAPGTIGSLCSLPLILLASCGGVSVFFSVIVVLFLLGWWATHIVLKTQNRQDPGFVVIDETIGQSVTFLLVAATPISWCTVVCGFVLFRFFDIVKIWPASFFDKSVHNAFGVMMDDVVAGVYASVVLYGLTMFIF